MRRLLGGDDDDDEDDCAFPAVPLSRMKSFLCWLTLQMCGYERSAHSHDVVLWGVKTGGTWKWSCIVKEMYHTLCTFCNNSRADNVTRTVMMVTNYFSVWDFFFFLMLISSPQEYTVLWIPVSAGMGSAMFRVYVLYYATSSIVLFSFFPPT